DKLPQKIQEALGRFERDNKKVGYACAHRELYCGNTFSEYDWATINEDGIWVEGKGEDDGWKIYSKR
ncbi:uncharacterized protein FOBCDRAFT_114323, partial [Fusarium oxysporum Fo47]|uniref:uncharacterized protein n=1 Tax=Fusarium oxysporum Fo47 TaxID=660027 RepID=UPI0028699E42